MVYYYFSHHKIIGRIFRRLTDKIKIAIPVNNGKKFLDLIDVSRDIRRLSIIESNIKKYNLTGNDIPPLENRIRDCVFSSGFNFPDGAVFGVYPEDVSEYKADDSFYKRVTHKTLLKMIFNEIGVFDTNLFMSHLITNHALPLVKNTIIKSTVFIPPIIIWELENKSRAEKGKSIRKQRESRLAKSAFRDITILQGVCKEFITYPKNYSISDFSSIKNVLSEGECDKIIRSEILKLKDEGKYKKQFVLTTSDSFNCLCAKAEGIETCFIPKQEISKIYENVGGLNLNERLGSFIREMAEDFGVISIKTKNIGNINVYGDWAGKRPSEWLSGRIMMEFDNKFDKEYKKIMKDMKIEIIKFY